MQHCIDQQAAHSTDGKANGQRGHQNVDDPSRLRRPSRRTMQPSVKRRDDRRETAKTNESRDHECDGNAESLACDLIHWSLLPTEMWRGTDYPSIRIST